MKISKEARQLAVDLDLNDVDAYMMELKSKLYAKAAELIIASSKSHEEIARSMGSSRSRIGRISKLGENNVSMELLIKLITVLDGKPAIKLAA